MDYIYKSLKKMSFWRQIFERSGRQPVDPVVFHSLVLKFETCLKVNFSAPESAWKASCHSTKMLLTQKSIAYWKGLFYFEHVLKLWIYPQNTVIYDTNFSLQTMIYQVYQNYYVSFFGFLFSGICPVWWC